VARLARVVAIDVAHHVTQRGNARQYILTSDPERMVYLDLLCQAIQLHSPSLIGYCLRTARFSTAACNDGVFAGPGGAYKMIARAHFLKKRRSDNVPWAIEQHAEVKRC
jgi:hypothetical protein